MLYKHPQADHQYFRHIKIDLLVALSLSSAEQLAMKSNHFFANFCEAATALCILVSAMIGEIVILVEAVAASCQLKTQLLIQHS